MEESGETEQFDKIIVYHNEKRLEIETETMDQILYYLENKKFELKDFSKFETIKQVLEYYCSKEKESIGYMIINFQYEKDYQEFFINFTKEIIIEKYNNNQQISKQKEQIELGLKKIVEQFKTSEKLQLNDLPEKYYEIFKTNKIPSFINNKLIGEIQSIQLIKGLNQNNYNHKLINDNNNAKLIQNYIKLLNGEIKPFQFGDKNILFNIYLYSNLKDIYKNSKIKDIIQNNYYEASRCFLNNWENVDEFTDAINNRKDIGYIDDKLRETFSKYEINENHIYTLSSYFYLIMNEIKDTSSNDKNGISFNCFNIYCSNGKYTYETYIDFINFFNNYIIINGVGEKENKKYDFSKIVNIIKQSKSKKVNDDFEVFKEHIFKMDKLDIVPKILLSKNANIFFNDEFKNSIINLIPLTAKRHSNTITILISGFLSQNDDINSWRHFFNYDRNNSNYYLFRWPSSDISTLIFKSLIFIFNSAKLFLQCKKRAKYAGKLLALFLANNEEFNNCQINIVGFSLGCQVTKYCIKELEAIKGNRVMINNVLFLAGATVMRDEKKINGEIFLKILLVVELLIVILNMIGF